MLCTNILDTLYEQVKQLCRAVMFPDFVSIFKK